MPESTYFSHLITSSDNLKIFGTTSSEYASITATLYIFYPNLDPISGAYQSVDSIAAFKMFDGATVLALDDNNSLNRVVALAESGEGENKKLRIFNLNYEED